MIRSICPYCGVGCGIVAAPDGRGGAEIAGDPDHPASDLDRRGARATRFVEQHTSGLDEALSAARAGDLAHCDLPASDLATFFDWFARTEKTVTLYSQGVNQSSAGVDKVNALINCHLLTGRIGRPGTGPFSITGQPNAMGGREVGALANTLAAHMEFTPADIDQSVVSGKPRAWPRGPG